MKSDSSQPFLWRKAERWGFISRSPEVLAYLSAQDPAAGESAWLPADVRVTLAVTTAKLR